jgi:hypothetical protein
MSLGTAARSADEGPPTEPPRLATAPRDARLTTSTPSADGAVRSTEGESPCRRSTAPI